MPHGWRSAFSTVKNGLVKRTHPGADRLAIDRLMINLMLAHVPSGMSETEFRYNRNRYTELRRELRRSRPRRAADPGQRAPESGRDRVRRSGRETRRAQALGGFALLVVLGPWAVSTFGLRVGPRVSLVRAELLGLGVKRYEVKDLQWSRIAPMLPGKIGYPGRTAMDNRLFVERGAVGAAFGSAVV